MPSYNKTNNSIFTTCFEEIKDDLSACPAGVSGNIPEPYLQYPSFDACGLTWNFTIPSLNDDFCIVATDAMIDSWDVPEDYLIQTVEKNIGKYLNNAAYTLLFGELSDGTSIPFMKIHFAQERQQPPYGIALLLSDEVASMIHFLLGDFIAIPVNVDSFYVVSEMLLEKSKLNPVDCVNEIMQSHPEDKPLILGSQMLFCEEDDPEFLEESPIGFWDTD